MPGGLPRLDVVVVRLAVRRPRFAPLRRVAVPGHGSLGVGALHRGLRRLRGRRVRAVAEAELGDGGLELDPEPGPHAPHLLRDLLRLLEVRRRLRLLHGPVDPLARRLGHGLHDVIVLYPHRGLHILRQLALHTFHEHVGRAERGGPRRRCHQHVQHLAGVLPARLVPPHVVDEEAENRRRVPDLLYERLRRRQRLQATAPELRERGVPRALQPCRAVDVEHRLDALLQLRGPRAGRAGRGGGRRAAGRRGPGGAGGRGVPQEPGAELVGVPVRPDALVQLVLLKLLLHGPLLQLLEGVRRAGLQERVGLLPEGGPDVVGEGVQLRVEHGVGVEGLLPLLGVRQDADNLQHLPLEDLPPQAELQEEHPDHAGMLQV
mmetsp:Transcript_16903/g.48075  ORF Transcript_16903/g.48075 Transcript_16903/m.48075 type:complete len:376 (+) Transcript_16903:289-1416(+)